MDDGGSCGVDSLLAGELVPLKAARMWKLTTSCGAVLLPLSSSLHVILHHQTLAAVCSELYVNVDLERPVSLMIVSLLESTESLLAVHDRRSWMTTSSRLRLLAEGGVQQRQSCRTSAVQDRSE
jgi:hypothetical protein